MDRRQSCGEYLIFLFGWHYAWVEHGCWKIRRVIIIKHRLFYDYHGNWNPVDSIGKINMLTNGLHLNEIFFCSSYEMTNIIKNKELIKKLYLLHGKNTMTTNDIKQIDSSVNPYSLQPIITDVSLGQFVVTDEIDKVLELL